MPFGSIQGLSLETFEVSTEALGLLSSMTAEFPIPSREINRGGQPTRNFLVTAVLRCSLSRALSNWLWKYLWTSDE